MGCQEAPSTLPWEWAVCDPVQVPPALAPACSSRRSSLYLQSASGRCVWTKASRASLTILSSSMLSPCLQGHKVGGTARPFSACLHPLGRGQLPFPPGLLGTHLSLGHSQPPLLPLLPPLPASNRAWHCLGEGIQRGIPPLALLPASLIPLLSSGPEPLAKAQGLGITCLLAAKESQQ